MLAQNWIGQLCSIAYLSTWFLLKMDLQSCAINMIAYSISDVRCDPLYCPLTTILTGHAGNPAGWARGGGGAFPGCSMYADAKESAWTLRYAFRGNWWIGVSLSWWAFKNDMLWSTCNNCRQSHWIWDGRSASWGYLLLSLVAFFRLDKCLPALELSIHVIVLIRSGAESGPIVTSMRSSSRLAA